MALAAAAPGAALHQSAAAAECSLAGRWVMATPDLYAMARVQFCVYEVAEASPDAAADTFVLTKVDEAGGCWGGAPCCGWWDAATGTRRSAGLASTLGIRFVARNGTVRRASGVIQPGCATFDLDSGEMFVRSNVSVWAMPPLDWLRTMTALTVRAARQTAADGTVLLSPGWPPHYGGQFVRDAFYGTSNALDLLPNVSQVRHFPVSHVGGTFLGGSNVGDRHFPGRFSPF